MSAIDPFSDEQMRQLVNLRTRYEVWIEADRALGELPYDLRKKQVGSYEYLYEIFDRSGNGKSLGPLTQEYELKLEAYQQRKRELKERLKKSWEAVEETGRLYRGLRLPMLSSEAGSLLREADRRGMLGEQVLVVGTNAMPAYSVEAAGMIRNAPDETEDFDIAWIDQQAEAGGQTLWAMLKAVDPTYTVNSERPFQARNARAYEVEVLIAPSRKLGMARSDQPRPVPLPEQEWLLLGKPVDQIVICRDGKPARIVAPDPRWFALQKLWMSSQAKRNPLKRRKDERQAIALLNAVDQAMPQFPIDSEFVEGIPDELRPAFDQWRESVR
jgi:hypothetical protein